MKIAVIDAFINGELSGAAQIRLPEILAAFAAKGNDVYLITNAAPDEKTRRQWEESGVILQTNLWNAEDSAEKNAPVLASRLNDLKPDVYLMATSDETAWAALPRLDSSIAVLVIGYEDSEDFYLPVRHYRPFLTRVVGLSAEVCVGYVLSCVIEKEKVEWISNDDEDIAQLIDAYEKCFEKAIADAKNAPRETSADYPLLEIRRSNFLTRLQKVGEQIKAGNWFR